MALDPVVIQMNVPEAPEPIRRLPKLPHLGPRGTKIMTAVAAITITITMVLFAGFTLLSNNKKFQEKHGLSNPQTTKLPQQKTTTTKSEAALPGAGIATGVGGCTGTVCPKVTITAEPSSVSTGKTATLKWSVTNNPKSCVASDDWSGTKAAEGTENTPPLTKAQTYLYTLTCKTATGTGFATVSVGAVSQGGTGSVATRPAVRLAANPTSVYVGDSSTLTWDVTNNPTSCKATGDWSGVKPTAGPASTGVLSTAKQYSFTLTCTNSAGSGFATATVQAVNPPPGLPIVTISANPVGPIVPGSSTTLSWKTTNNPASCIASGDWSGAKPGAGTAGTGALNSIRTYTFNIDCKNAAGEGTFDSVSIVVIPNPPTVSLTVNPSSILVGNSATLNYSVTNITAGTTCTGYGSWPGSTSVTPVANGSKSTGVMNVANNYGYSLRCTNEGGTQKVENVALAVTLPPPPVVSLSVSPISITTGNSATLTWSATNNPTSCTASGAWTGTPPASPASTGTKTTGNYTYNLQCSNAGGPSNTASTTLSVSSGVAPPSPPVVTISVTPGSISTGSAATVSWSATNSPTSCTPGGTTNNWVSSPGGSGSTSTGVIGSAGTRTYTMVCSNNAGTSNTASATLTIVALPTVSVSLASPTINAGSSTTYSWSSTGASSCTGGGQLSGSKATSGGPVTTGTMNTAGTYNYTITCVNSIGGSASSTAVLTVNSAAPVYCAGKTPCYGVSDLAAHASSGNCWSWNLDWVINITSFRPNHPGGIKSGSTSTIESASATCNHDIHSILAGSASIPGYKDSGGSSTHGHNGGTVNNTGSSGLASGSYHVGYYDASKP